MVRDRDRFARACRWRRKRGPVWRVRRDHLRGYAMDSNRITRISGFWFGCPAATLVALRQPRHSSRGHRCPDHLRSASLSQGKSSSFCTGQRRKACGSRRASDYSLRNQLGSPFPAPNDSGRTNHALRARLVWYLRRRGGSTHRHRALAVWSPLVPP